jgi:hypothetical protein
MLISTWVLLAAGLVFSFPMIYSRVKDHTELEDETLYAYFICYIVAELICLLEYEWTTLASWSGLTRLHTTECGGNKAVDVMYNVRQCRAGKNVTGWISLHSFMMLLY